MQEPELSSVVVLVKNMVAREHEADVDSGDVEELLRAVLFEPRNLWEATNLGLVTRREVANAVAAHVHRWLVDQSGELEGALDASRWEAFIKAVEETLFPPK